MPRPGPRTADNHRREPLSVSQPTHTFKIPDPAPCFCCPPVCAFVEMHAPEHTEGREYLPVCPKRHSCLEERTL